MDTRCQKEYMVNNREQARCVRPLDHADTCQLNLWWAVNIKVPLELEDSTSVGVDEPIVITIRRVK